ncbi:hypothetical protein cyc_04636 [Cyclospora cayetanensis]|uniref:Uncharacterized protein n=1 Tax=Cyclospora cayetanensis TaxID=88456 RepID=A0A1D3CVV3_9EIME|nr:hypothetical protein cyc_04636 [Cyclospora cayetanensis]
MRGSGGLRAIHTQHKLDGNHEKSPFWKQSNTGCTDKEPPLSREPCGGELQASSSSCLVLQQKFSGFPTRGCLKRCAETSFHKHWISYVHFLATAAALATFVWYPVASSATDSEPTNSALGNLRRSEGKQNELLFAEPLYGDETTFVSTRVQEALAAGSPLSYAPQIAAEASVEISWSVCSRLCNGGTQSVDRDRSYVLAVEGLRHALLDVTDWSDSYEKAVQDEVAKLLIVGDTNPAQLKTRPCNTFRCPLEVPTDLATALMQIAREPKSVASFGVLPQVDFSLACQDRHLLERITQDDWDRKRSEQRSNARSQQVQGSEEVWESTVLEPQQLSLYSCVSLCRLYRLCGAVIYTEDIEDVGASKIVSKGTESPAGLEEALVNARFAVDALEEGVREMHGSHDFREHEGSPSRNPVCSLYTRLKVSRVTDCGVEAAKKTGNASLTLLVLNENVDFAEAARGMRSSLAMEFTRQGNLVDDAANLMKVKGSGGKTDSNSSQWEDRLKTKVTKANKHAVSAARVLLAAVGLLEGAARQAHKAISVAQSAGSSQSQVKANPEEAGDSGSQIEVTQPTFHTARPLSASCPVFTGVELLGRGCVEPFTLRTHHQTDKSSSSRTTTSSSKRSSPDASPMTWHLCRQLLEESSKLLETFRATVSQMEAKGSVMADVSAEAQRLGGLLLDLDSVQTANLSIYENGIDVQTSTNAATTKDAPLRGDMDTLSLRKETVERLGKGSGNLFAVFDTVKEACAIKAIFEPRITQNGDTLDSSASAIVATDGDSELPNGQESACPEVPCIYSTWTSWSPCYVAAPDVSDDDWNNEESEIHSTGRKISAIWQVRFQEVLLRPKAALQCDVRAEARLCTERATADTEVTKLMSGFTGAIANHATNWCQYSPFSEWGECTPECLSDDTVVAYRTRTRSVQQYPVTGLAPSCDPDLLESEEVCPDVPMCAHEEDEGGEVATADEALTHELPTAVSAVSDIHLHIHKASLWRLCIKNTS